MREQDRKFFEPLWRRIAVIVVLLAWTAWEWSNGESLWGTLVAGVTAYFVWAYVITFPAEPAPDDGGEKSERQSKE
jgi:hypothetical protein